MMHDPIHIRKLPCHVLRFRPYWYSFWLPTELQLCYLQYFT